ncbi:MAG: hypothetical protein KDE27_02710 [Planctomycetes bacterium]|nr:hypothetical protein [Planctomycetota bacterium]
MMPHRRSVCLSLLITLPALATTLPAQTGEWQFRRYLSERVAPAMAWDAARERLVLFGGSLGIGRNDDTMELVGGTWTKRSMPIAPAPRESTTMVFDEVRRTIVLFGGFIHPSTWDDNTWEYDGETWRQLATTVRPPARYSAVMSWDSTRQRAVLFSGLDSTGTLLGDTWEWDGVAWLQGTPSIAPPPRSVAAMAYDAARQRTVLFGGYRTNALADTWLWDGTSWSQSSPAHSPPARYSACAAYDPIRQRVVVAGGAASPLPFRDTWEWNGTDWQARNQLPGARRNAIAAFDARQQRVVVCCGLDENTVLRDTIGWDGNTWTAVADVPIEPTQRERGATADGFTGPVLLFGGYVSGTSSPFLADTWLWQDQRWQVVPTAPTPPGRFMAGMARDLSRDRAVLFGGFGGPGPTYNLDDTWEWNGSAWTQMAPGSHPSARSGHQLAWDPVLSRVLLFGGSFTVGLSSTYYNDTWSYDGLTWTQHNPATSPSPRVLHGLASDLARQRIVLFGGAGGTGGTFGDTWEWDGANWLQQSPALSPSSRADHAMTWHAGLARTVLFGGIGPLNDTWTWDGNSWSQIPAPAWQVPRTGHVMAYHAPSDEIVLATGDRVRMTMRFATFQNATTQTSGSGCPGTNGVPRLAANDPYFGNPELAIDLLGARAGAPALIALALGAASTPLGGGCTLELAGPTATTLVFTNGDGFATQRLALPNDRALRGVSLFAQAGVLDPLGALPGVAFTPRLELTVGD